MTNNALLANKQDDTLKFIALLTMLIDHIGYLLFPQHFFLRIIGRLSFPIFAFLIAQGARRTKHPLKYASRLLAFGIISQIPYNLFTHNLWWSFNDPNIFFTLLTGLIIVLLIRNDSWPVKLLGLLPLLVIVPLNLSYSFYGVFLIILFYSFDQKPAMASLAFLLITLQYSLQFQNIYQLYALPSLLLIFQSPQTGIHIPKWVGYLFYPVHLLLLFIVYFIWF